MIAHEISYSEDRDNISEFIQLMTFERSTFTSDSVPLYISTKITYSKF